MIFSRYQLNITTTVIVLALCAIATGLITSMAAIAFVEAIAHLNEFLIQPSKQQEGTPGNALWGLLTIAIPVFGGLVVGHIYLGISNQRNQGLVDAIKAAHRIQPQISLGDGLKSALATIVSMGCGASVGHYGPLAHLGTTLGSTLKRLLTTTQFTGTIAIGCGAAAAIATAFNAPLAGIVFSHEVILRHYSLRSFAPIAISASTGYFMSHIIFQRPPIFQVGPIASFFPFEYAVFIGIGLIGAVIAMCLVKSVIKSGELAKSLPIKLQYKPAIAGLILGLIALWIPDVLTLVSAEVEAIVLHSALTSTQLVTAFLIRFFVTALCLGFGFAGGIFSPSLLIGALFGTLVGINLDGLTGPEHSNVAVYAICGMMAVTSPIIGAPLTSILIIIELTNNYDLATAAMISVVFSNLIAYRLFGRSLFDIQLKAQNFDISMGRDKVILTQRLINAYVNTNVRVYPYNSRLSEIWQGLKESGETEAYVLGSQGEYIGTISLPYLISLNRDHSFQDTAQTHAKQESLIFDTTTTVWDAMESMTDFVGESIPVIETQATHNTNARINSKFNTATDGQFRGIIYEADIIKAYLQTVESIRNEEHAAG